jgi:uncharacterized protein YndB with AHSA1/START domain
MTTDTISLRVERLIPGSVQEVFDAWLNPDQLRRWMVPSPGMTAPRVTVDARVGGKFHITMESNGRQIPHDGEYRVIDRPRKLVFTWISEPAGNSLVTVEFHEAGARSTRIVLTHEQLPSQKAADAHRGGWTGILTALEQAFSGGESGVRH